MEEKTTYFYDATVLPKGTEERLSAYAEKLAEVLKEQKKEKEEA